MTWHVWTTLLEGTFLMEQLGLALPGSVQRIIARQAGLASYGFHRDPPSQVIWSALIETEQWMPTTSVERREAPAQRTAGTPNGVGPERQGRSEGSLTE